MWFCKYVFYKINQKKKINQIKDPQSDFNRFSERSKLVLFPRILWGGRGSCGAYQQGSLRQLTLLRPPRDGDDVTLAGRGLGVGTGLAVLLGGLGVRTGGPWDPKQRGRQRLVIVVGVVCVCVCVCMFI